MLKTFVALAMVGAFVIAGMLPVQPDGRATAQSQTTIWSATLTVDVYRYFNGCDNNVPPELADCSTNLTDDDFTYEGVTFSVRSLYWDSGLDELELRFSSSVEDAEGDSILSPLTLNVDGVALAFKDAHGGDLEFYWDFDPDTDWTDGQEVSLSLTEPTPEPTPTPQPTPTPTPQPTPTPTPQPTPTPTPQPTPTPTPQPTPTPTPQPTPTPTPQPGESAQRGSAPAVPPGNEQERELIVNNEPEFDADTAERAVAENSAVGTAVGKPVTATDADRDPLTYGLTGSDAFGIDAESGQITVQGALDYEATSIYSVTVSVSDGLSQTNPNDDSIDDTIAVTIRVTNVDEPGVVRLSWQEPGASGGSRFLYATLHEPDAIVGDVTWSWQRSADGKNWTAIEGASGSSYTPTEEDAGHYILANAAYEDGHGSGKNAQGQIVTESGGL